jgi:hypothetical protein
MNTETLIPAAPPPAVNPGLQIGAAQDAAKVCREIVRSCAVNIGGRQFVTVEGFQAIAAAFGCILSAGEVETLPDGLSVKGRVIRAHDGAVIAEAEGFLGNDETTWARRPMYARRAMACTRAMSRAARCAFGWVVTLIDRNLCATPAEEVPEDGFPAPARNAGAARMPRKAPAAPSPEPGGTTAEQAEESGPRPLFPKRGGQAL